MGDPGYEVPTNQYAVPDRKNMEIEGKKSDQSVSKSQRRINCILIVLVILALVLAIVGLAISISKDSNSSEKSSSTEHEHQAVTSDACSSGPCTNQGTCVGIPPEDYVCTCVASYYGRNCEHGLKDTVFFVRLNGDPSLSHQTIIRWNTVDYDPGNNYDTVTGAYTAPSDGYYQFSVTKYTDRNWSNFVIIVDGAGKYNCWSHKTAFDASQASCTVTTSLKAGQKVQVQHVHDTNVAASVIVRAGTWFTGYMLYPTYS